MVGNLFEVFDVLGGWYATLPALGFQVGLKSGDESMVKLFDLDVGFPIMVFYEAFQVSFWRSITLERTWILFRSFLLRIDAGFCMFWLLDV